MHDIALFKSLVYNNYSSYATLTVFQSEDAFYV